MMTRMRMLAVHRQRLSELLQDTSREQGCFLFCKHAQFDDETVLLVKEIFPLTSSDYVVHRFDQLSVSPEVMLKVARLAQKLDASVCMVHTHPMSNGSVSFSEADDIGNVDTFRFFCRMLPGKPHSCLVWDGPLCHVAGRVYKSATVWEPISQIEIVSGARREVLRANCANVACDEEFDRQARLLGAEGQAKLSPLHVGVAGCGGIGSVASVIFSYSGVTKFTLIDFDHIDKTNLPRILGSTPADVEQKVLKADIAKRNIEQHKPEAVVDIVTMPIEQPAVLPKLAMLDLIICGTDDTTSRAFLNQVCHQFYIPILDLGVQFSTDKNTGQIVKEIGKAHLMLPGSVCMLCTGDIDPKTLADEALSTDERKSRQAEGYVGADVPEPSMLVFNMQVAARGVQHVISWVTGLFPRNQDEFEMHRFFGLNASPGIKAVRKHRMDGCLICGADSQILGMGSSAEMLVKPRPK